LKSYPFILGTSLVLSFEERTGERRHFGIVDLVSPKVLMTPKTRETVEGNASNVLSPHWSSDRITIRTSKLQVRSADRLIKAPLVSALKEKEAKKGMLTTG